MNAPIPVGTSDMRLAASSCELSQLIDKASTSNPLPLEEKKSCLDRIDALIRDMHPILTNPDPLINATRINTACNLTKKAEKLGLLSPEGKLLVAAIVQSSKPNALYPASLDSQNHGQEDTIADLVVWLNADNTELHSSALQRLYTICAQDDGGEALLNTTDALRYIVSSLQSEFYQIQYPAFLLLKCLARLEKASSPLLATEGFLERMTYFINSKNISFKNLAVNILGFLTFTNENIIPTLKTYGLIESFIECMCSDFSNKKECTEFLKRLHTLSIAVFGNQTSPCGLPNLGNSDYINASIQLLLASPKLITQMMSCKENESNSRVLNLLKRALKAIEENNQPEILHTLMYFRLFVFESCLHPDLIGNLNGQEDAKALLELILTLSGYKIKIRHVYKWHNGDSGEQSHCGDVERHAIITMDIDPKLSFQEHVSQYFAARTVNTDQSLLYGYKEHSDKPFIAQEPPEFLFFALKRFGPKQDNFPKTNDKIKFDSEVVDLTTAFSTKIVQTEVWYEIIGTIDHFGPTCSGGHYIAKTRRDDQWFTTSDTMVFGGTTPNPENAYIVLLRKLDTPSNL